MENFIFEKNYRLLVEDLEIALMKNFEFDELMNMIDV